MKLATFVAHEQERFGFALAHPATGEMWVFDPEKTELLLSRDASVLTSPLLESRSWPSDMVTFLGLGDVGMSALCRLQDATSRFLERAEPGSLAKAGYPLHTVRLRAPIPRPRIYFGLVANSPTFLRHEPSRIVLNRYPQGHARPQGTVCGPDEPLWTAPDVPRFGWNPELGVVIGRGGKYIDVRQAREHIAGLTLVLDANIGDYYTRFDSKASRPPDWFADATASWLGKSADTMCPMGPYLTTLDDIDDIYDLLVYTRQSGWLRDRSHTNSMLIGVEELISWLSSFMTLCPGDVLHMATMGLDGVPMTPDMTFGPQDRLEGEIEKVGTLRTQVVQTDQGDWRLPDDAGRTVHPSPAARDVIHSGQTTIERPEAWTCQDARHFWTVYGNYEAAPEIEGMDHYYLPRVLNGPVSALTTSDRPIEITRRAQTLSIGVELAFVVGRLAYGIAEDRADEYVLGYVTMASILDSSFDEYLREPVTSQERNMPGVYGRWGDGFNAVSTPPVPLSSEQIYGRRMSLSVDGYGETHGSTDEYLLTAPRILAFLSSHITLFPGDVVTFGRVSELLTVPGDRRLQPGTVLHAAIDGLAKVHCPLVDERSC